jgi:hypothetical protein
MAGVVKNSSKNLPLFFIDLFHISHIYLYFSGISLRAFNKILLFPTMLEKEAGTVISLFKG